MYATFSYYVTLSCSPTHHVTGRTTPSILLLLMLLLVMVLMVLLLLLGLLLLLLLMMPNASSILKRHSAARLARHLPPSLFVARRIPGHSEIGHGCRNRRRLETRIKPTSMPSSSTSRSGHKGVYLEWTTVSSLVSSLLRFPEPLSLTLGIELLPSLKATES